MEEMSKHQLVLLVLLVSFMTALVTGIVTVTLMDQAPKPITQTIQRVIERSIGKEFAAPLPVDEAKQLELAATARDILIEDIITRTSPAVVSIIASKDVPVLEECIGNPSPDEQLQQFLPDSRIPQYCQKGTQKRQVSAGSGFFVGGDGLVLTNKHVVNDTSAEYTIIINNGEKFAVKVLARDPLNDMAVLKVNPLADGRNFPSIALGNSDTAKIGQSAIAIGNALGEFQNTVSVGVISGLARSFTASSPASGSEDLSGIIQTDAAINPGNSGGPLLDLRGEVIGLNTAIAEGAQSIGFAIPINQIKRSLASVKDMGKIVYPFLGVRYITVTPEVKEENKLAVDYGALLSRGANGEAAVSSDSPAEKAGLLENDIILEFGGKKVTVDEPLGRIISGRKIGDKVTIKIMRAGNVRNVEAVLEERK